MNGKVKSFEQTNVSMETMCSVKNCNKCLKCECFVLDTGPQSFCHSFIALLIIRRSKSARKFAVRVYQVATVVMVSTQLILSQF